ncbi:hypothetical protein CRP01_25655 [Flavilitoribacter nigricans DSM 23189 = NBRC 102662]|uniref:Uncharacterized protein n=1 Tax=Flavilitoribacter nigricans (strain ATCC 23147 / DSM 23189 / NBRC 102662 / NCIMB 1420 / SS-2) TaxID=1122177 RepID=A0A2D0N5D1_FLAN2|nr:hypothetical protein CRP01_25655 [Flavilitoribacter nigricans DSM 23189 = NBRC 102662]
MLLFLVPVQEEDWTEYRVEAGNHDFRPNDFPAPHFGADHYTADLTFTPSCWWSQEDTDYTGGRDIYDWNKIGGMTNFFNSNSTHSVMLGWRPAATANTIEVTAYINPKEGRFVTGPVLQIPVNRPLHAEIKWASDTVYYEYGNLSFSYAIPKPWSIRKIGPWFGGNQPAHREMFLKMQAQLD